LKAALGCFSVGVRGRISPRGGVMTKTAPAFMPAERAVGAGRDRAQIVIIAGRKPMIKIMALGGGPAASVRFS